MTQMFVNLPVKDLDKSVAFFTKLGFKFNPQFTDKNATCMIVGKDSFVMLLVENFFKGFTNKQISDATKGTEAIIAISVDERKKVDEMVKKAVSAGGKTPNKANDHGWMYGWGFEDLDGHLWEVFYMDISKMPKA